MLRRALGLFLCAASASDVEHVLLVVVDDLGHSDLGFTGSEIRTPHIDALAADGVVLENFYVQRACSPTRAALLTGRYNIRYGFQSGVLEDNVNYSLPLTEALLPQVLKANAPAIGPVRAHMVGKWHLGYFTWAHTPTFRGFDSYYGYYSGAADYFTHAGTCGGFDLHDENAPSCGPGCSRDAWEAVGAYSTHLFAARAVERIAAHDAAAAKLLLYAPFQAVHEPRQVPERYTRGYAFPSVQGTDARTTFAGMLACLDEAVGNITRALDAKGMLASTLVWLQTDNGAATPACGGWTGAQNWPLRGGKCTAWEGGLRGTALVWADAIDADRRGARERALMHTVDVLPTLVAALGGAPAARGPSPPLDGVSQWAVIARGAPPARDTALLEADPYASPFSNRPPGFVCYGDQHATPYYALPAARARSGMKLRPPPSPLRYYALRRGRWKLLLGDPGDDGGDPPGIGNGWWCAGPPCPASHNNSESVGGPFAAESVMLFDLEADANETTDVSALHADVVANLTALIAQFNASAVDSSGECLPADPAQAPELHNGTCTPWG